MADSNNPEQIITTIYHDTKVVVFEVIEWPEVDFNYNSILLCLPGGYKAQLSGPNAQRFGQRLNSAGGGQ